MLRGKRTKILKTRFLGVYFGIKNILPFFRNSCDFEVIEQIHASVLTFFNLVL